MLKERIRNEQVHFITYLQKLIKNNRIDDGEALEISIKFMHDGLESLSNQHGLLFRKGILSHNFVDNCERCSEIMPLSNMYRALFIHQDHLCENCRYYENKVNV